MKKTDWWEVNNLKKNEKKISKLDNSNELRLRGDFGSYRMLLKGEDIDTSMVSSHNDLNPKNKIAFILAKKK